MILVTGATGYIGRHIVSALMEAGLPARCLVPEHRLKAITWDKDAPHAPEVVIGDILNEEAVFKAVTGAHTVIHLESAMWWGRMRDLERVEVVGTRTLLAAARSGRVGRIITLSHLGATPSSAYMLHRAKGQVEELVRASGLAYTILRCGVVFGEGDAFISHIAMMLRANPLFFLMPGEGEVVLHPLYIGDLVQAVMRSLESLDALDRVLEIGGQEYTTLEDLLYTVMRVCGMYRPLLRVPPYAVRALLWGYRFLLPRTLMTAQWLDMLATSRTAPLSNMYDNFGFQPRRFEDTLLTYLPKQAHLRGALQRTFRARPKLI